MVDDAPGAQPPPLATDPQAGECVLCFVARAVAEHGCDGTTRWCRRFVEVRVPAAVGAVARLSSDDALCDGAITTTAHELVREQLVRDLYTDELMRPDPMPPCAGVRPTSARACRHWVRVRMGGRPAGLASRSP